MTSDTATRHRAPTIGVGIRAVGRALPDRVVTNAELEQRFDTTDQWIRDNIGVRTRRVSAPNEGSGDLGARALLDACEQAGVDVDTIERIDAAGDYMCIQTGDNTLILRETMKDLEKRLDPRRFQRGHRSTIVNLDLVRQVKPHTNGECFLVLNSGAQVKVSRSYRDVVARFVH